MSQGHGLHVHARGREILRPDVQRCGKYTRCISANTPAPIPVRAESALDEKVGSATGGSFYSKTCKTLLINSTPRFSLSCQLLVHHAKKAAHN